MPTPPDRDERPGGSWRDLVTPVVLAPLLGLVVVMGVLRLDGSSGGRSWGGAAAATTSLSVPAPDGPADHSRAAVASRSATPRIASTPASAVDVTAAPTLAPGSAVDAAATVRRPERPRSSPRLPARWAVAAAPVGTSAAVAVATTPPDVSILDPAPFTPAPTDSTAPVTTVTPTTATAPTGSTTTVATEPTATTATTAPASTEPPPTTSAPVLTEPPPTTSAPIVTISPDTTLSTTIPPLPTTPIDVGDDTLG